MFWRWHAGNCQKCKNEQYRTKLQPVHLYEILDEKIKLKKITPTKEEIEIIKLLNKNQKDVNHQSQFFSTPLAFKHKRAFLYNRYHPIYQKIIKSPSFHHSFNKE